ncbi:hypothetical protein H9L39_05818 [Fusarium oxysporum f. sp. albedinis]|nr:hypothetical protein H9L39_05818 [Fusarium oxysporum f. sp. albedinis]
MGHVAQRTSEASEVGNIANTTLQLDEMVYSDTRVEAQIDQIVSLDRRLVRTRIFESCPEWSGCAVVGKRTPDLEGFVEKLLVLFRPSGRSIEESAWSHVKREVDVIEPGGIVLHLPIRVGVCVCVTIFLSRINVALISLATAVPVVGRGGRFVVVGRTGGVREPLGVGALGVSGRNGVNVHRLTRRPTFASLVASRAICKPFVGSYRTLCCRGVDGKSLSGVGSCTALSRRGAASNSSGQYDHVTIEGLFLGGLSIVSGVIIFGGLVRTSVVWRVNGV